jgi:hypothetical protein
MRLAFEVFFSIAIAAMLSVFAFTWGYDHGLDEGMKTTAGEAKLSTDFVLCQAELSISREASETHARASEELFEDLEACLEGDHDDQVVYVGE